MAIAWLACFPKLLCFYPNTPRRVFIMLIWGTMANYHAHSATALRREGRLLRHEVMKAKCVIANALAGMACILLFKRTKLARELQCQPRWSMPVSFFSTLSAVALRSSCTCCPGGAASSWSLVDGLREGLHGLSVSEILILLLLAVILPAALSAY